MASWNSRDEIQRDFECALNLGVCLESLGPELKDGFIRWKQQRLEAISTIGNLQEKIESISIGCTVAQGAGSALAVIGCVVDLVGIFMKAAGKESADTVLKSGTACSVLGTATAATATLAELGLSQSVLNKIKTVLRKDDALTEPFRKWLKCSKSFDSCLRRILNCSVADEVFDDVVKITRHAIDFLDKGVVLVEDILREIKSGKKAFSFSDVTKYPDIVIEKFCKVMKIFQNHPECIEPLRKICQVLQRSSMTYKLVVSGLNVSSIISTAMQVDAFCLLTIGSLSLPKSAFGINVTRSALDVIGIAINLISAIVSAKSIIEKKSKYSKDLTNIQEALTFEYTKLEETFQV